MAKSTEYRIVLSNTGGELDSKVLRISDTADYGALLKAALLAMIEEYENVEPGDTFTVETI